MPSRFGAFWFLVAKDVVGELRARRVWPAMLFLGLLLVLFTEMQIDLAAEDKIGVMCGLLWLDVFFAGSLSLERSFASEREEGCWRTLLLYPISPTVIFLAKMAVSFVALVMLEAVLIAAFVVFGGVPLLAHPVPLGLIVVLGNLGLVAVGVLVSALVSHASEREGLLALVLLPLMTPVLLAAAEGTRLAVLGAVNEQWWRWLQLLAAFAVLFTTLGMLIFRFAIED